MTARAVLRALPAVALSGACGPQAPVLDVPSRRGPDLGCLYVDDDPLAALRPGRVAWVGPPADVRIRCDAGERTARMADGAPFDGDGCWAARDLGWTAVCGAGAEGPRCDLAQVRVAPGLAWTSLACGAAAIPLAPGVHPFPAGEGCDLVATDASGAHRLDRVAPGEVDWVCRPMGAGGACVLP